MATTASNSGAAKKKAVKKKVVKKRVVKKKVAKKKVAAKRQVDAPDVESVDLEESAVSLAEPMIRSAAAVQETITTGATKSVRSKDITAFLRQLIMMLEAGTPILKALKSLSHRGEHKGIRSLVSGIADYVEAGNPLWQAFAREGKHFSSIYVSLIKAAEVSGSLTMVLRRLVDYRDKREQMRKRLIVAMIYPTVISVVAFVIVWLLSHFLIPEFVKMFKEINLPLEGFTGFILNTCTVIGSYWTLLAVVVFTFGGFAFLQWWVLSPLRRVMLDRLKFKIPIAGQITQGSVVAEFARTFAMLQRSGVLMMSTLELCRNSATNRAFAGSLQDMRDSVERGDGLEGPLRDAEKAGFLPGVVVDMLITGEETGSMDTIADQLADSYEEEVDLLVDGLKEALQPIFVVGIGFVVGSIVIALFLPLVKMIEQMSGASM
ncbi:type II secretion system F family protein [bacterium AH-315-P07]|nr:type II secretion system F family protein [bacterium AH-315-P07]